MFNTILIPVDDSEYSDKALTTAYDFAERFNSKIHLIRAASFDHYSEGIFMGDGVAIISQPEFEKLEREILVTSATKLIELGYSDELESHYSTEPAGKAIINKAEEIGADLIVMGAKGHSDLKGLLLGSTSHKVCNKAKCSCLLVR